MPSYNPDHEALLKTVAKDTNAEYVVEFGYPTLKKDGKVLVGVKSNGIAVKIGENRAKQIIATKAGQPHGLGKNVWKDWVLLPNPTAAEASILKEALS